MHLAIPRRQRTVHHSQVVEVVRWGRVGEEESDAGADVGGVGPVAAEVGSRGDDGLGGEGEGDGVVDG